MVVSNWVAFLAFSFLLVGDILLYRRLSKRVESLETSDMVRRISLTGRGRTLQ